MTSKIKDTSFTFFCLYTKLNDKSQNSRPKSLHKRNYTQPESDYPHRRMRHCNVPISSFSDHSNLDVGSKALLPTARVHKSVRVDILNGGERKHIRFPFTCQWVALWVHLHASHLIVNLRWQPAMYTGIVSRLHPAQRGYESS